MPRVLRVYDVYEYLSTFNISKSELAKICSISRPTINKYQYKGAIVAVDEAGDVFFYYAGGGKP